jgi:hypothetical protein
VCLTNPTILGQLSADLCLGSLFGYRPPAVSLNQSASVQTKAGVKGAVGGRCPNKEPLILGPSSQRIVPSRRGSSSSFDCSVVLRNALIFIVQIDRRDHFRNIVDLNNKNKSVARHYCEVASPGVFAVLGEEAADGKLNALQLL